MALLYSRVMTTKVNNAKSHHNNASGYKSHDRGFDRRGSRTRASTRTQVRAPPLQVHHSRNRTTDDSEGDKGLHPRTSRGRLAWETSTLGRHQQCAPRGGAPRAY